MNDDAPLTAEQLQQATSRALPPGTALDAEAAALREGFLQLGGALDTAAADYDEAALLAKLTSEVAVGRAANHSHRSPARSWAPLILTGALAASGLVAVVRTANDWRPAKVAVIPNSSPAVPPQHGLPAAWSDPLDDEIASAQVAVDRLAGQTTDLDGSLDDFGSRLQSLAAELESGSL